ncbi:MAG: 2-oxoacid:acceptor oxidoreductase family protein [Spirochaetales bacterium]|nr:2-oxoacid:acceptor oxidoreductase family protein [Spirochaetales bacterium]
MKKIFKKSDGFYDTFFRKPGDDKQSTTYCSGCGHGIVHKLVAEALVDLDMLDKTTFISPVGCSVFAYYYFKCGNIEAAHGRAPAVATGIKRALPESYVVSYQGDGDLAAIGTAEIIHAANRGENITVIFVNNAVYGMTGGQMAPTTLIDQKTTTTPRGRSRENEGMPIKVAELIATLPAPVYVERTSLHDISHIMKTRLAIRKALRFQKEGKGFTLIEVLSQCPTNWKVKPDQAGEWIKKHMLPYYDLGVFRDTSREAEQRTGGPMNRKASDHLKPGKLMEKIGIKSESESLHSSFSEKMTIDHELKIRIAGFGGQGVLYLGQILCQLALKNEYRATWFPAYGPAMRGGTANCSVVLSNREIASPIFSMSDILVAMNQPSFDKFSPFVSPDGYLFCNSSIISVEPDYEAELRDRRIKLVSIEATSLAEEAGFSFSSNIVILGKILKTLPYFHKEDVFSLIKRKFRNKEKLIQFNVKAFTLGFEA